MDNTPSSSKMIQKNCKGKVTKSPTNMTHNNNTAITYVNQLTAKKDLVNMKVRIIRVWDLGFRLDMVLIDEKGSKIQASVKKELIPKFKEQVKEDAQVMLMKVGIGLFQDTNPVLKSKWKVNFYTCTELVPELTWHGHLYGFSFVPFDQINMDKAKEVLNIDIIGSVIWCGNLDIFWSKGKEHKRFNLELKDLDGRKLKCTLWGDYAVQFNTFVLNNNSNEHVITIFQHAVIKLWLNEITVQTDKHGTRVFINEDIQDTNDFRRRLILKEGNETASQSTLSTQTVYPNRVEFLVSTPRKKVDEIRETEEKIDVVVVAKIVLLEEEYGWFYVACKKCNKKVMTKVDYLSQAKEEDITEELLNADPDSLWCPVEKCQATQLIPRFRVTFRVQDDTGSVSFLMFDRDVTKLVGVSAVDIRERQLKGNATETYPHELEALVGKHLAFKISIAKYNLEHSWSVYTVIKYCDDSEVIAELLGNQNDNDEAPTDSVNEVSREVHIGETSVVKLSESSQGGFSSKDAFSVTGDSLVAEQVKDTDSSPVQKRDNETPGVESGNKGNKRIRKMVVPFDV